MSLSLHFHPLASFCWKVLIALYENDTPFEHVVLDLGDESSRARFLALWPMGMMPVLRDDARDETVPESSVILDYLDEYYPGPIRFTPADPKLAWRVRLWDRFFDLHVHEAMQKIVTDRIRPSGKGDTHGVAEARAQLRDAYPLIEREAAKRDWFSGDSFGLADCAASPALYYANRVEPLGANYPAAKAYLNRLVARPSFARVLADADPYFKMFPEEREVSLAH